MLLACSHTFSGTVRVDLFPGSAAARRACAPRGSQACSQRLRLPEESAFRGRYGVEITARPGSGAGAKLNKWFYPGYDQAHACWYCRFAENFDQGHHVHFSRLLANCA